MFENFDIWRLLAGLGIFLFGMFLMEESVKNLAGRSFKRFIRISTTGRIKSIFSGALVTSVLQSSSAVSLMVLAFVGAGIMAMENAIGVILGSNIGTTLTAWIVAFFGFKLNIESFSLPLIGIGGLGIIFLGKSVRYANISKLLVGFGFLFMGLDYMKNSVSSFADGFDMTQIPDYGIFVYLAISIVLTAIMQSSSAMIAIVLTALNAGIIDFNAAAGMVIGANVGTTFTILLGAIGAGPLKKRVAASHLFFNLFTAAAGLLLLPLLVWIIQKTIGMENSIMGVALFHTLFNVTGVLIFLPFIGLLSKLLIRVIPEKTTAVTLHINNLTHEVPDAAIASLKQETIHLIKEVLKYNLKILNIDENLVFAGTDADAQQSTPAKISIDQRYDNLKLLQAEIFTFSMKVQSMELDREESHALSEILHVARAVLQSAKSIKDIRHNFEEFENADNNFLNTQYTTFRKRLIETYLSIIPVFNEQEHQAIVAVLTHALNKLKAEDRNFMDEMHKALSKGLIRNIEISTLLVVNRTFVQSSKQIIKATRELLLTEDEIKIFESMEEVQENTPPEH